MYPVGFMYVGVYGVGMEADQTTSATRRTTPSIVRQLNAEDCFEATLTVWGHWHTDSIATSDSFGSWEIRRLREEGFTLELRSNDQIVFSRD